MVSKLRKLLRPIITSFANNFKKSNMQKSKKKKCLKNFDSDKKNSKKVSKRLAIYPSSYNFSICLTRIRKNLNCIHSLFVPRIISRWPPVSFIYPNFSNYLLRLLHQLRFVQFTVRSFELPFEILGQSAVRENHFGKVRCRHVFDMIKVTWQLGKILFDMDFRHVTFVSAFLFEFGCCRHAIA